MISSQPASSVPFAPSPLQAAPDQGRATWHGVDSQSRRAFSFNQFGRFCVVIPRCRGMVAIRKDAIRSGQSSFKAKGAASGQDATPSRSAAGQSAAQLITHDWLLPLGAGRRPTKLESGEAGRSWAAKAGLVCTANSPRPPLQFRNNTFGNNSDCFRSRSSRRGQGAADTLATHEPSPFCPPFIRGKFSTEEVKQ